MGRKIYWWGEGCEGWTPAAGGNFGDALVPLVLEKASVTQFEHAMPEDAEFVVAGSILEHLPSGWAGTVCGAGLLHEDSVIDMRNATVLGVRGKLTLDRLKNVKNRKTVVLGDPALLVPSFVRQYQGKWDLGVIPHWSDKELMKRFPYGHYIDVRKPPEEVIEDIAKCKRVISSSLHGIIVADAYGIPRQAELFPDAITRIQHEGGDFKYRDYASIYDTHPHFGEFWTAPRDKVMQIQHELRVMLAKATETVPPPEPESRHRRHRKRRCWPRRRPPISLLVPFRDSDEYRTRVWHWLKQYWYDHLDSIEIIEGHDYGFGAFSKAAAVNEAASRARGRIFIIVDADTIMDTKYVKQYVKNIEAALKAKKRLWYVPYRRLFRLNEESTLAILGTDPADTFPIPSPPPENWLDNSALKNHDANSIHYGHQYGALILIMPREAFFAAGGFDPRMRGWGCCDEETEILTAGGWKRFDAVKVGEQVLTLNHETGLSEWNPIQKMNIYRDGPFKTMAINSTNHSSLTTMDHRWPVITRNGDRVWRTTETLNTHDRVPISAKCADLPTQPTHSDALVELIAWLFTEGHLRAPCRGAGISQSHIVHPAYCAQIESACARMFGEPSERFWSRGKPQRADVPRWYRRDRERDAIFRFNAEAADILLVHAPDKVPSFEFLRSLTQHQLDLFIDVAMKGDGSTRVQGNGKPQRRFEQRDPRAAEAFAFAVILSGDGVSIRLRNQNAKGDRSSGTPKELDYAMTVVNIRYRDQVSLITPSGYAHSGNRQYDIIDHDGPVWCPTTENGTWLARRNGSVYWTGNSEDVSFMRAVDTLYTPHELGDNDVVHLWHTRAGMDWESRRWVGQPDVVANSRLGQRYGMANSEPGFMYALTREYEQPRDVLKRWWRR